MPTKIDHFALPDACHLLDALLTRYGIKNDAELCRRMAVLPSRISKMRSGRQPITAELLLRVHETFGLPFSELRMLLRRRPHFMHSSPGRPHGGNECGFIPTLRQHRLDMSAGRE